MRGGVERLRRPQEFERVFRDGRCVTSRVATVCFLRVGGPTRVGVAVARRVGPAVVRNRVRRRVREVVRLQAWRLAAGWHVVVIGRRPAETVAYRELEAGVVGLWSRAGLTAEG